MGMTARGHKNLGGNRTVINPFMPGGEFQRVTIEVDNAYNRGYIPPYSLWAPSNFSTSAVVKYLPFIPPIAIKATDSLTYYDIDNEWHDYFRAGDELIALDISKLAATSSNQAFFGKQGSGNDTDLTTVTLGTHTVTVAAVGMLDSGGTGETRLIMSDMLDTDTNPATGALGTGDVLVLAGADTTTSILAYAQSQRVVIMEQAFNFQDPTDGLAPGNGGILVESVVYSYSGVIDQNHVQYHTYLNDEDTSPAVATGTTFSNGTRFNFRDIWRG
ncbi:MAG: hypothetical protein H8D23_35335 [Candidatus Brocadiales bacterium]|nr:hypothetical protein [Candidatus Brocadiales bacterium]